MLIKACFQCKSHKIKQEVVATRLREESQMSFCHKENCWSEYSDCIKQKALERFLYEECIVSDSVLT